MTDPAPALPADELISAGITCPNCGTGLASRKTTRGLMYYCPKCRGRAVGLAVLRRVLGGPLVLNLWSHARVISRGCGKTCPSCRRPMADVVTAAKHGSVHLDVCTRCQFAWFDAGEFEGFPLVPAGAPKKLEASLEKREAAALEALKHDAERRRGFDYGYDDGPDESWKWIPAMFGLPVEEDSSVSRWPWLTWGLSAVLVVTFLLTASHLNAAVRQFGLIPAHAWRHGGATLLTSFFIHGSFLHLFGNLYFLLVFGDNVESDLGRWRYAALLLGATLAGDFAHIALDVRPAVPCVGASGGIAGLLAFYALRFPRARIHLLFGLSYYCYPRWVHLPAYSVFLLWIAFQLLIAFLQTHAAGDVSGLAHVGGAIAGCIAWTLRRFVTGQPAVGSGDTQ